MKTNYHTHYSLCKHAVGTMEEYVVKAIENNYEIFGISEHVPDFDRVHLNRMSIEDLEQYYNDFDEVCAKYHDKIELHIGFEAEFLKHQLPFYEQMRAEKRIEYLILGHHYLQSGSSSHSAFDITTSELLLRHAKEQAHAFETGLFDCCAHPDLGLLSYPCFDKDAKEACKIILSAAERNDMPLEINCNGIRKGQLSCSDGQYLGYPNKHFWKIAGEYDVKVIIGSDAHDPNHLDDNTYVLAGEIIYENKLQKIDALKLLKR